MQEFANGIKAIQYTGDHYVDFIDAVMPHASHLNYYKMGERRSIRVSFGEMHIQVEEGDWFVLMPYGEALIRTDREFEYMKGGEVSAKD